MSVTRAEPVVHYPDSDGQPMSDNTLQFRWIVTIQGNLDDLYRDVPDVFVAGDHLIYPVKGDPKARQAPDVYVAFGRPKGDRGSYKVWEEGGVFPQVVFEVWSPHNRASAMQKKFEFYEKHGAEEYYIVYPDFPTHLDGWRRQNDKFAEIDPMDGWVSPRLGVRFGRTPEDIALYRPDGSPFLSFLEMAARAEDAARRHAAERARAEAEEGRAEAERARAEKLAAKLRELGLDPDAV
jgi:Uma2 family endonuclease